MYKKQHNLFEMVFNTPKTLKIYQTLYRQACSENNICLFNKCTDKAINSHLLQKKKVLDKLSIEQHLVEIKTNDLFRSRTEGPVKFNNIGIAEALASPLFCNKHDAEIFAYIEKYDDFQFDYLTGLLFSYRSLCAEIRKKDNNRLFFEKLKGESKLKKYLTENDLLYIERGLAIDQISLGELGALKWILEGEILHKFIGREDFPFLMTFGFEEYKQIDVCMSAITTFFKKQEAFSKEIPGCLFIHIVPTHDKTMVITGYHNQFTNDKTIESFNSWHELSYKDFTQKVTETMIRDSEAWVMSPRLFLKLGSDKLMQFKGEIIKNVFQGQNDHPIPLNLFE